MEFSTGKLKKLIVLPAGGLLSHCWKEAKI